MSIDLSAAIEAATRALADNGPQPGVIYPSDRDGAEAAVTAAAPIIAATVELDVRQSVDEDMTRLNDFVTEVAKYGEILLNVQNRDASLIGAALISAADIVRQGCVA